MRVQADRVVLAEPRGFCAGVEMAIKALGWMILRHGAPVYCVHQIVHNRRVVDRFRALGVIFVDDPAEIPSGVPVLLSAHGSTPAAAAAAAARASVVVDAVCPLVAKVHHEIAARAAAGDAVVYVGHPGHDEAVGAMGVAPHRTTLVSGAADLDAVDAAGRSVALLAQTTLAVAEWQTVLADARRRFGPVWTPKRDDVCYATTNRQEALRAATAGADAVVVVGSAVSANTAALAEVARQAGVGMVLRVDGAADLPAGVRVSTAAVTAGASAPPDAVREVVEALRPSSVERVTSATEDAYFPPPIGLRRLLAGDPSAAAMLARDRRLSADMVLSLVESALAARAA